MFTTKSTAIAKLRAYHEELKELYVEALRDRDFARARTLFDARWRVRRAILIREEWCQDD